MRRLFLRNIVRTGRVFAMNDCGSVLAYTLQRREAAKARDVPRDEAKIIPVPAAALSGIRPRRQKKYPAAAARQIIRSGA